MPAHILCSAKLEVILVRSQRFIVFLLVSRSTFVFSSRTYTVSLSVAQFGRGKDRLCNTAYDDNITKSNNKNLVSLQI